MRNIDEIDVPPRFALYVVVGGAAAWLVRHQAVAVAYVLAVLALVVWLIWKGKLTGRVRR